MNILYIGPNDSEWAQMNRPVSLAGAKWARGFLAAFSKYCNLTVLTHTYEIAWPKGNVFWRGWDERLYSKGWACESVSYPVLKYVREWWWRFAYAAKAQRIVREKNIDSVLMYNCYESWQVLVLKAITRAKPLVRIYPIILDGDDPRKDDWGWMRRAAQYADGFVALSWWIHQNIPKHLGKPSYHMDGGADGWCGEEVKVSGCRFLVSGEEVKGEGGRVFRLAHTGALDQWRGLDFMVEVVKSMTARRKDVKFIFCGKSSRKVLEKIFGGHPQVELPGFVSEREMNQICNGADVLLNVRDPNHPDNILNYPSKLPHYLSFGRPIVSTRLQSLAPDYNEVVRFVDADTVTAYVEKIDEVLAWNLERRCKEYDLIRAWFNQRKRWDVLVKGLVEWIGG